PPRVTLSFPTRRSSDLLGYGFLKLRDGRRDIRELDDVRLGPFCQFAKRGKRIGRSLAFLKKRGEIRQNSARKRNVRNLNFDIGSFCKGLYDGQERMRREHRRFIRQGVIDL